MGVKQITNISSAITNSLNLNAAGNLVLNSASGTAPSVDRSLDIRQNRIEKLKITRKDSKSILNIQDQ